MLVMYTLRLLFEVKKK